MDFSATYKLESNVFPGVIVTLSRIGPRKRATLELKLAEPRAKERELSVRLESQSAKLTAILDRTVKDKTGAPDESALSDEAIALGSELLGIEADLRDLRQSSILPEYLKAAVKGFSGEELTYDGEPASVELLCEHGPDELFREIVAAVNANGYLSPKATENLSAPTTSPAAVDGTTSNMNAGNAESAPDSPSSAAALNTSPTA